MLYLASTRRPQNILLDDKNDTISAEIYLRGAIGLINHFANLVKNYTLFFHLINKFEEY